MKVDLSSLPDDEASLKEIIQFQAISYEQLKQEQDRKFNILQQMHTTLESNLLALQQEKTTLDKSLSEIKERNALLEEQIRLYRVLLYGRKSEKDRSATRDQLYLFNEAEETATTTGEEEKQKEIL